MEMNTARNCTPISLPVRSLLRAFHGSCPTKRPQEWVSGEPTSVAQWEFDTADGIAYYKVWRQIQIEFDESDKPSGNGMAEWGSVYWATDKNDGLTVQSGADYDVRSAFARDGKLGGSQDSNFRSINDNWPVFGFANDFGNVGSNAQNQLFTIGLLQQNAVQFLGSNGLVKLPSLWTSYFSNEVDAVSHVKCILKLPLIQYRFLSSTRTLELSNLRPQESMRQWRKRQLLSPDKTTALSLPCLSDKHLVRLSLWERKKRTTFS
jgi:hypothetical protein